MIIESNKLISLNIRDVLDVLNKMDLIPTGEIGKDVKIAITIPQWVKEAEKISFEDPGTIIRVEISYES